jgi:hypothetical protein
VFCNVLGEAGVLVPRFLEFEARLVPGHVGARAGDIRSFSAMVMAAA